MVKDVAEQKDFRGIVAMSVSHAIQGTVEFSQGQKINLQDEDSIRENMQDFYQNRNNWVNIATDHIMQAFENFLPHPVDMDAKYETTDKGVHIQVTDNEKTNGDQLTYLANYAHDEGYNQYHTEIVANLKRLYSPK